MTEYVNNGGDGSAPVNRTRVLKLCFGIVQIQAVFLAF